MAEIIDIVAAACSIVFVVIGAYEIFAIFSWNKSRNSWGCTQYRYSHHCWYPYENAVMHNVSEGLILILCGISSCAFSLGSQAFSEISKYFGFMVYLTSRGCYFIFMGLYLLPNFCPDGTTWGTCMNEDGWTMVCTLAAAGAVVVGIVLIVIGCSGNHTTGYYSGSYSGGTVRQMDIINIMCIIASSCILALGIRGFMNLPRTTAQMFWYQCVCRAFLTTLAGGVSLGAAIHSCVGISVYFGFLHSWTGSAIFYILAGCYVMGDHSIYYQSHYDANRDNLWLWVYYGAGALSVIVGIIKLVMRYCAGGGNQNVYYTQHARTVQVVPVRYVQTTPVVVTRQVVVTQQPVVYQTRAY